MERDLDGWRRRDSGRLGQVAPDPPERARSGLDADAGPLRRDVDLPEVGNVERAVRAEGAMARSLEPIVRELGGRSLDPVHREVEDRALLEVDAHDLEPDRGREARGRDRREVAEEGHEGLSDEP